MAVPSDKSPKAFRTISEVAEIVGVAQHVLRFWETRFPQIQPLKRGGNRRYYRPVDVALLERINRLLYAEGYTIKGVQKLLAESGDAAVPVPVAAPALSLASVPTALPAIRAHLAAALAAARAL